jgi:SAM-dependent methyltransferase
VIDYREQQRTAYETAARKRQKGVGPAKLDRWRQTLTFVPRDITSLLDCGCDTGQWLDLVAKARALSQAVGIDVARNRVEEGKSLHPHLDLRVGYVEDLAALGEEFDAVTALEVLEHIPEWEGVLEMMFQLARKTVLITVPYREQIVQTVCIHCGQVTPLNGHLRVYDEDSFRPRKGWQLQFGWIMKRGIGETRLLQRIRWRVLPERHWLVALFRKEEGATGPERGNAEGL